WLRATCPSPAGARSVGQRVDGGQVAALLVVIHAVAEDIPVRDLHSRPVGADAVDAAVVDLGGEHRDADVGGAFVLAPAGHRLQGVAFVEDVVDQDHAAATHRRCWTV